MGEPQLQSRYNLIKTWVAWGRTGELAGGQVDRQVGDIEEGREARRMGDTSVYTRVELLRHA